MPSDKNRSSEVRNGPSSVFVSFRQGSAGAVAVGVGGMGVLVAVGGTGVLVAVGGTGVLVGVVDGSGVLVLCSLFCCALLLYCVVLCA